MRVLLAVGLLVSVAAAEPVAVAVRVGLRDTRPTPWAGQVSIEPGRLVSLAGWLFGQEDGLDGATGWHLTTDPLPSQGQPRTMFNGLLLEVDAGADAALTITANQQPFTVRLSDLAWGRPAVGLNGAVEVARAPRYTTLRDADTEDDFPAATTLANGEVVAVWQSWTAASSTDQLHTARWSQGAWAAATAVPGVKGDLYRAAVTADGPAGCLVAWSQLTGDDYDIWSARCAADGRWTAPVNVSKATGHDADVALATAPSGEIYAVWRGYRGPSADILMAVCRNGEWGRPVTVDGSPANEWAPAVAAGPAGVWAAWDSYRHGSYDVFAAPLQPAGPGPVQPVAATARFEAKATVACGPGGEVWIGWQEAGEGWGKDTGFTVPKENIRQAIFRERTIGVACLRAGSWFTVPAPAGGPGEQNLFEEPQLCCESNGRLWLAYRRPRTVPRGTATKSFGERVWETYLTSLEGAAWAPPRFFAGRMTRQDSVPVLARIPGGVMVVAHTDGRQKADLRRMTRNRIDAAAMLATGAPPEPVLTARDRVTPVVVSSAEASAVERCRNYAYQVGGQRYWLVRGDLHRHTEVSWDGTGDGSLNDAYRYAMDAAGLDYFEATDHNQRTGVDLDYIRWWNYKLADIRHNPGSFVTLFGFERSLGWPNGHRNIIQTNRDQPSFKMTGDPNDLPRLYEYARTTNSLVIPHTSATGHGTNWYAYDADVEPVVEIFQGCRLCYEYEGCPKGGQPGDAQADRTGYQPEGFVWRAWQKGCRLGIIASSDHGSTHYSYAAIYTPAKSRQAIFDSLRARRTFGANDNIIVDVKTSDHAMGEAWRQAEPPQMSVKITGTGELKEVVIIRDYQFVYTVDPPGDTFELDWQDNQYQAGSHLYYVRVQQDDTSTAWSSPVWITKG